MARFAGDEFVVVLSLGDPAAVDALCDRLLRALATPTVVRGVEVVVTASIGVARCCDATAADLDAPERLTEALLHRADAAMYEVKGTGQGGWRVHDPAAVDPTESRLRLVEQARHAIADGRLRLHHQPRVRVGDGVITGVEALVRWQHPERGLLAPGHFIEPRRVVGPDPRPGRLGARRGGGPDRGLERSRPTAADERQRLRAAARRPAACRRSSPGRSPATACRPRRLVLEITETALMLDPETAATSLGRLRDLGTRIAVDDFGTGYASLTYLRRFPVHEPEDRPDLRRGPHRRRRRPGDRRRLPAPGPLARPGQRRRGRRDPRAAPGAARGSAARLAQGYLLGRPVPADEPARGHPAGRLSTSSTNPPTTASHRAGSVFHSFVCRPCCHGSARTTSGRAAASASDGPFGTYSSASLCTMSTGRLELGGPGHPVEAAQVERLLEADQPSSEPVPHEHVPDAGDPRRHVVRGRLVVEHGVPVDHRRVEHDADDDPRGGRPGGGLQHDRATHRPPHEQHPLGAVLHGPADGVLDVAPLAVAQPVPAGGVGGRVGVVAVGRHQGGDTAAVQQRQGAQALLAGRAAAVHEHRPVAGRRAPGTDGSRHQPGRQPAQARRAPRRRRSRARARCEASRRSGTGSSAPGRPALARVDPEQARAPRGRRRGAAPRRRGRGRRRAATARSGRVRRSRRCGRG
nr:GGDEF domain-containing phosphodiesterase [Angustibacter aerolatus]